MKVESRGLVPLDIRSLDQKKIEREQAALVDESALDTRDIELSRRLRETIEAIGESGLSAGDFHSGLDETRVHGLLHSLEFEARRPRLADEELLALADRVQADLLAKPEQAGNAFKEISGARVAELLDSQL